MAFEIERKFLIFLPENPDDYTESKTEIVQTYLLRTEPSVQRRVRSMTACGETIYYYTEKRFISDITREEHEEIISEETYNLLLAQQDMSLNSIIKTRRIFTYDNQVFEMDCYPFSDKYATVETEIPSENTVIRLPSFLDIVKEVTGDPRYSNASLALAQAFPEE